MFGIIVPDSLKPVVDKADRLEPRWNREQLEHMRARGLVAGPARGPRAAGGGAGRVRGEVRAARLLRRGGVRAVGGAGLLPAPAEPCRVPAWSEAKAGRDFCVRAGDAFYSVPWRLAGQQVSVRADGTLVKIYCRGQVIRAHPRQPAGGRVSDPADFPPDTDVYARRDVGKLARMAAARGESIGAYAARILDTPLPWTKTRCAR
jgi:hypothetical protein